MNRLSSVRSAHPIAKMGLRDDPPQTLLDAFLRHATLPDSVDCNVLECGDDALTYGQVFSISRAVAFELSKTYGELQRPTVAIVSENHPYTFIIMFATWLLGGIVAPIDHHTPEALLRGMLNNIKPTCVVLPSSSAKNVLSVQEWGYSAHIFDIETSTISSLIRRFCTTAEIYDKVVSCRSMPDDIALLIHTSSASSISNLKCVILSHASVLYGGINQMIWLRNTYPSKSFDRLRLLGWSPWSHMMGISHDLTAHCLLTGGCYVFGVVPSSYANHSANSNPETQVDLAPMLLQRAHRSGATAFAAVPWVLQEFMKLEIATRANTAESQWICETLRNFKVFLAGGAATDIELVKWAEENGLNLVTVLGMTEIGGPLFHSRPSSASDSGWLLTTCLVRGVKLMLMDELGSECEEGELHVKSKFISYGYRGLDNQAFSTDSDGFTTFRTGDVYSLEKGCLTWQGRRDDYIQLTSGETLDPRIPEKQLDANECIVRSCLVGNKFLSGASEFIYAIVETSSSETSGEQLLLKAFASVNSSLPPPLRVPISRVLILRDSEKIPLTRKGMIWRKTLEQVFGERLLGLSGKADMTQASGLQREAYSAKLVHRIVIETVGEVIGLTSSTMEENSQMSFAEFGMDSQMAVKITNLLNKRLVMNLAPNALHEYIDLHQLSEAILRHIGAIPKESLEQVPDSPDVISMECLDPVVFVGQALRLPGNINSTETFWRALLDRRTDIIGPIPPDRWDHGSFYDPSGTEKQSMINFNKAGFIDISSYDNAFFMISGAEALYVSPSSRLALEISVEALENANISLSSVKGTNMGVFVAVPPDDGYTQLLWSDRHFEGYTRHHGSGTSSSTVSGRLSYFLDVHGPSMSIDTACSGGLVALDAAVKHIKDGDCDSAIVCSVNTHIWPGMFVFLSANQMASPRGRCATFTDEADGYAPSEGVVAFVVKKLSTAIRDQDEILGVVRSTAVQHNGRSQGLVAPNAKAQVHLQQRLLSKAGLRPSEIDFVEAHGTGTSLGDLIEMQAINDVFVESHSQDRPLVIGASKTVFGHTESTAGLVGVAKTLYSLRTGIVPGLAHLNERNLNPHVDLATCPLVIPHSAYQLRRRHSPASNIPMRALTLAYGFAGTISGVVIEEYKALPRAVDEPENPSKKRPHLFVLSAKSAKALTDYLHDYVKFCLHSNPNELGDICHTSCVGREHHRYRFSCVVYSLDDLIVSIRRTLSSPGHTFTPIKSKPYLVFTFPGQGSQYQGMARKFCDFNTGFGSFLRGTAAEATSILGFDILPFLIIDDSSFSSASGTINQTHVAQAAIFVFQCATFQWLKSLDIHPEGVLPHSVGEVAAAVAAGIFSFQTGLEFTITRSRFMEPDPERPGAMASISTCHDAIEKAMVSLGINTQVSFAALNGANRHVMSGDEGAINRLVELCSSQGIRCRKLPVNQAFHSHLIESALEPIRNWFKKEAPDLHPPIIDYYSSVTGQVITSASPIGSDYWVRQARNPVRFSEAAQNLRGLKPVFVDLGPLPALPVLLHEILEQETVEIVELTTNPGGNPDYAVLIALAKLYTQGVTPNFSKYFGGSQVSHRKTHLPTYPWQRQIHYPSLVPSRSLTDSGLQSTRSSIQSWPIDQRLRNNLRDHSYDSYPVVPAAAFCALTLGFGQKQLGSEYALDIHILRPLVLDADTVGNVTLTSTGRGYTITFAQDDCASEPICRGILRSATGRQQALQPTTAATIPKSVQSKMSFYDDLNRGRIRFGPLFQNVSEIQFWEDHVDGCIETELSDDAEHNLIRQLDSCLHMFASLFSVFQVPEARIEDGAFLPSALIGFRLHRQPLPRKFTCRYHLPFKHEQGSRKLTASFQVFSDSGDILAECDAYTVAWIPSNISWERLDTHNANYFSRTVWVEDTIANLQANASQGAFNYVGKNNLLRAALNQSMSNCNDATASALKPGDLTHSQGDGNVFSMQTSNLGEVKHGVVYMFDMTPLFEEFSLAAVNTYCNNALTLLRSMYSRLSISRSTVIFLTTHAFHILPEDLDSDITLDDTGSSHNDVYLAGSLIHGLIRVLRNELSSNNVWAVDVPTLAPAKLAKLLAVEVTRDKAGLCSPVVYRARIGGELVRLVPSMRQEGQQAIRHMPSLKGAAVIAGMGDIGTALASGLIEIGCRSVIFLSRKRSTDLEVKSILRRLRTVHPQASIVYQCTDVASYDSVRDSLVRTVAMKDIGPIEMIVHTAAVVKDALLVNTTNEQFEDVVRPKVWGAWNLHRICEDLSLPIRYFVMLSSVSVPLANPGQGSYVAANSFLDALATYRTALTPSVRSVSIQLGPWESKLISRNSHDDGIMGVFNHNEGIPLLLRIIGGSRTVQILAKFNRDKMRTVYHDDRYFFQFLGSDSERGSTNLDGALMPVTEPVIEETVLGLLQEILEEQRDSSFDTSESLSSLGVDSIAMTQLRARLLSKFNVNVPLSFLADDVSLQDLITHVFQTCA